GGFHLVGGLQNNMETMSRSSVNEGTKAVALLEKVESEKKTSVRCYTPAPMRVLGIDPGSQTTGWGIVEGDGRKYSLIEFGSIRAASTLKFPTRLLEMCTGIEEVIAKHQPDACALEDAFLATNVKVSMKLGQVRGVILLVAERAA